MRSSPKTNVRAAHRKRIGALTPIDRAATGRRSAIVYRLLHGDALARIGFIRAMSAPSARTSTAASHRQTFSAPAFRGGEVNVRDILPQPLTGVNRARHCASHDRLCSPQPTSILPRQRADDRIGG